MIERYRPLVVGVLVALLLIPLFGGINVGSRPLTLVLVPVFGLVLLGMVRGGRRGRRSDKGWVPVGPFEFVPTIGAPGSPPRRVAAALGHVEARLLVTSSVAFAVGIGFSLVSVALFGFIWSSESGGELAAVAELLPIMAHPLAGMTIVAAHRARTRARRDGLEELFTSCPTTEHTRTVAHLRTGWMGALVALLCGLAIMAGHWINADVLWGPFGGRQIAHLMGSALLLVGAVALGVGLARWAPWTVAPVVAVVAIGIVSIQLSTSGVRNTDPSRQLSTWLTDADLAVRFTTTPWAAHHLWVLALVAIVIALALLRDVPNRRRAFGALGVFVLAAAAAGFVATRPISDADAQRMAAQLADPASHQTCVGAVVPVCAYAGDESLAHAIAKHADAVATRVPAGALDGVSVRQGAVIDRFALDPAIATLLPPARLDAILPVDMIADEDAYEGVRFWLALHATGALDLTRGKRLADVRGRANGVIAIWLATRDLPERQAKAMSSTYVDPHWGPTARPWPDECVAGDAPAVWAMSDLTAARLIMALPDEQVGTFVTERWDDLTDPAMTTDALLHALGLDPLGEPTGRTPGSQGC